MMKSNILTILFLTCAILSQAQSGLRPRGDVNCDWEVNIGDLNALVDSISSGAKYHSFYSYATDVNGDKEINISDINMVIDAILGKQLPPMPSYSGTLPVLFINTDGYQNIVSRDEYIYAFWWLDNMGLEGYESIGSPEEPQTMQIKGRGNYTWTLNKKPFRIKLDEKQPLMGMKKNRNFCLLASDLWTAPLGFELSRRIGLAYTPAIEPVEIVLNGQYIGLYYLTEKIKAGKDRVEIIEQSNGDNNPNHITGGWLIEIDNHPEENQFVFQEGNGNWMGVIYHSPDSVSPEQLEYIRNFIADMDTAIYCMPTDSNEWENYIDIDSMVSFYIVNEIADEVESFTNSLYLHKHRGDSTKLIFGPVWDFGCSFGRTQEPTPCFIYENTAEYFTPHWLKKIVEYPHFQECVRQQWNSFYHNGLETIIDYMDNWVERVTPAAMAEIKRWPEYAYDNNLEYQHEHYYKPSLIAKINWLNEQWGETQQ